MRNFFLISGSVLAGLSVILGAFGAHKLKEILSPESLQSFQTGVQYQMYHSLALILTGILSLNISSRHLAWAGNSFLAGILLFSGSIYLLVALKEKGAVGLKGLGLVTPIGGLFFILGWILLVLAASSGLVKR